MFGRGFVFLFYCKACVHFNAFPSVLTLFWIWSSLVSIGCHLFYFDFEGKLCGKPMTATQDFLALRNNICTYFTRFFVAWRYLSFLFTVCPSVVKETCIKVSQFIILNKCEICLPDFGILSETNLWCSLTVPNVRFRSLLRCVKIIVFSLFSASPKVVLRIYFTLFLLILAFCLVDLKTW